MSSLGQRIRELRMKKQMTQMDLAKELCTPSMISQIESDRARPSYKVLFAIAERLDVSLDKLLVDVNLDMEYNSKYKMALALAHAKEFHSAIPLLEELADGPRAQVNELDVQFELGLCYMETGSEEQAAKAFIQVQEAAAARDDHRMIVQALLVQGQIASRKSEYQIALYHSQRAHEEYQKMTVNEPTVHARVLYQIASLNQEIGKVDEAADYYKQALQCYEGCSDLEGIGKTYLRLSETYQKSGDFEKSTEYATLALAILKTRNHLHVYQDVQRQLILLERGDKSWQDSVRELQQFAQQYEDAHDAVRAGETYADMAAICLENEQHEQADEYAHQALEKLDATQRALGKAHQVLAFLNFRRGVSEAGRYHLDQATEIFEGLGLLSELEEITMYMCEYLENQGQHKEAFNRLAKFHHILQSKLKKRGIAL
jgi:HTH-type transcriptional regulator, quorum sensing regulator NprR